MKSNKILKSLTFIFESLLMGSIFLYIYNLFESRKYEIIPDKMKTNMSIFTFIALVSFILFLILKYVLSKKNKTIVVNNDQIYETSEPVLKNLEEPVVERVIIHKDEYDVPKERRMLCPNCKNIIDKNAFICLKCGYLIREIVKEKVIEKHYYPKDTIENNYVVNNSYDNTYDKEKLKNILLYVGLSIGIVVCIILIIVMASKRGML